MYGAPGLNIYENENKLTPKIMFPWSEIRNIRQTNLKDLKEKEKLNNVQWGL